MSYSTIITLRVLKILKLGTFGEKMKEEMDEKRRLVVRTTDRK